MSKTKKEHILCKGTMNSDEENLNILKRAADIIRKVIDNHKCNPWSY